jgi:uncharacterized membrane protein
LTENEASNAISQIHLEETLQAIGRLHAEHHASATRYQRVVQYMTSLLSRPRFLLGLSLLIGAWMASNLLAAALGRAPFDPPPFEAVSCFASVAALYLVIIVLTTQSRDDLLAQRRELLMLELAILAEQKTAKAIELLEELRRDIPSVRDRVDSQADIMARPADPQSVVDAIHGTQFDGANMSSGADGARPAREPGG